jgi:NADPH2:quinone reductase
VKVLAAGVSAYDIMLRRFSFPGASRVPYTPGEGIVGVVDELGQGVSTVEPGQRVAGFTFGAGGGHTEFICRPASELVPVPSGLDSAEAVCLVVNYLTAYLAMHETARVQSGERILVHGAAGGVGSALLQLGKLKPVVAERVPLVEAARAHELLECGGYAGKVVLVAG